MTRSSKTMTQTATPRAAKQTSKTDELVCDGQLVRVTRKKNKKRLTLRVVSCEGPVLVSVPWNTSDAAIRDFVRTHAAWIAQQRKELSQSIMAQAQNAFPEEAQAWREVIAAVTPPLIEVWERRIGVQAGKLAFRNMKTRWGSCQPATGRICINTRLALFPPECLEYVVVHELCHLIESGHGPRFYALLDTYLPDWRTARAKLK